MTVQWLEATDPASGRTYWYDANNHSQVTWDNPYSADDVPYHLRAPPEPPPQPAVAIPVQNWADPRPSQQVQQVPECEWRQERLGCLDDISVCCFGAICGCVMFGSTMDQAKLQKGVLASLQYITMGWVSFVITINVLDWVTADENISFWMAVLISMAMSGFLGCQYRKAMVNKYPGLKWEGDIMEWLLWSACGSCSTCQEHVTIMNHVGSDNCILS